MNVKIGASGHGKACFLKYTIYHLSSAAEKLSCQYNHVSRIKLFLAHKYYKKISAFTDGITEQEFPENGQWSLLAVCDKFQKAGLNYSPCEWSKSGRSYTTNTHIWMLIHAFLLLNFGVQLREPYSLLCISFTVSGRVKEMPNNHESSPTVE